MMFFFDRAYRIGLGRRKDRDWTLDVNRKILGMDIKQFQAFDGTRLRLMDDPTSDGTSYLRGAVGCYLSHLAVLQDIATFSSMSLVLEDDAVLSEDFYQRLEEATKHVGPWDHIMLAEDHEMGTWAYIIKKSCTKKIIDYLQDRVYPIDVAFSKMADDGIIKSIRVRGCVKHLHEELGSNISSDGGVELQRKESFDVCGEDLVVEQFFEGKQSLTFLDIGCGDARRSVTRRLALKGGWRGIYIEPDPYQFVRLHLSHARIGENEFICAAMAPRHEVRNLAINRNEGKSTTDPVRHERRKQELLYWAGCKTPTVTPWDIVEMFGNDFAFVNLNCSGLEDYVLNCSEKMLEKCQAIRTCNQEQVINTLYRLGFTNPIMATSNHVIITR